MTILDAFLNYKRLSVIVNSLPTCGKNCYPVLSERLKERSVKLSWYH